MTAKKELDFFQDFDPNKAFNWILAIEPELGSRYFFKYQPWKDRRDPDREIHSDFNWLKDKKWKPLDLKWHHESDEIYEIDNLHEFCDKDRNFLIDKFTKDYKNSFTLGECGWLSWWVHFHVFSQLTPSESLPIFRLMSADTLQLNTLNVPLFCVPNKGYIYARHNGNRMWSSVLNNRDKREVISSGHSIARVKNDYLPWVEYRANNVFDIRLYWYYVALTLTAIMKISLDTPFLWEDELAVKIKLSGWTGFIKDCKRKDTSEDGILHCDNLTDKGLWFNTKDTKRFSLPMFKRNIGKMYFILLINNLPKAKEALEEYIKEMYWFTCPVVRFDFITWAITKASSWYIVIVKWVTMYFRKPNTMRTIYNRFVWSWISTVTKWALTVITNSIQEVKLTNITPVKKPKPQWLKKKT